jgi:hypothetical protein
MRDRMRYVPRMWENLSTGRTFDVTLVVVADIRQRERLRRHFGQGGGWNTAFSHRPVEFASLDELGRPWRGGNFDASLFALQRIRRLLLQRGVPDGQGRSLVVLAAGQGTRAYPLTAAEGGNKSMIRTPAQVGQRSLRLIELVLAQYHQILDEVEPGRIHIAAGDHLLAWERPPLSAGGQHMQIFANRTSFGAEAEAAGLLDGNRRPRWADDTDLRRRLAALDVPAQLPILHSLTQLGLLRASTEEENLLYLVEKADEPSILKEFADSGGEARVNWWDWSLSPEAARLVVSHYADLIGRGIDLSIDVLEPVTLRREEWCRRRPLRDPELWNRANTLFENATTPGHRPLGPVGVADPGERSVFADLGTLRSLHEAFASALEGTEKGEAYRSLLGTTLENGVLFVGDRPGHRVEVEPGSIVIDGAGIRSGRVGVGSVVVDARVGDLRAAGRCIVYGVRAPGGAVRVTDGGVAADVVQYRQRRTIRGSLFGSPRDQRNQSAWLKPRFGSPLSVSDQRDTLPRGREVHGERSARDAGP